MPKRGVRASSGPWSRLKAAEPDFLESMGLPSKGDDRLLDPKTQEKFYTKIVERYMSFCSDAGQRDELLRRFSAFTVEEKPPRSAATAEAADARPPRALEPSPRAADDTSSLRAVLSALRKLREGIVASHRADDFATQAYLFCIRLSILVKQPESYHPAMLHLLHALHAKQALTSIELQEVAGYLVLDTACRRRQLAEAHALRRRYGLRDAKIGAVLAALAHDNCVLFWRVKGAVDGHKARLMDWAEAEMRTHALKCIGKSYLSVDLAFVERMTAARWEELTRRDGVGWRLEKGEVVIRKPRTR